MSDAELSRLRAEREALFGGSLLGVALVRDGRFLQVNDAFARIWGEPAGVIIGRSSAALALADAMLPFDRIYDAVYVRPDGVRRALQVRRSTLPTVEGHDDTLYSVADVTDQEERTTELERARTLLVRAVDAMSDGFVLFGADDRILVCNQIYATMLEGFDSAAAMTGMHVEEIIRRQIAHGQPVPAEYAGDIEGWIAHRLALHRDADGVPHVQRLRGGRWVQSIRHRTSDGGIVVLRSDITALKEREQAAHILAQHDALTGLPNRRLLHDRLTQALGRAARSGRLVAVLAIDLDEFKPVNDTHGHKVGDEVLRIVAGRLTHCLRGTDTVARVGGDEFIAVIDGLADSAYATAVAGKIIDAVGESIPLAVTAEGQLAGIRVGCSIGISLFPDDATELDALIRLADAAMYRAKQAGRGRALRVT